MTEILERMTVGTAADLRYFLDQIEAAGIDPALVYLDFIDAEQSVATLVAETLTDGSKVHNVQMRTLREAF